MKNFQLLLAAAWGLAACQSGGSPGNTDSVTTTAAQTALPDGYYEANLPAASSPGRLITLQLTSPAEAQMTTDYLNSTPEIVQMGNWSAQDDGTIMLTLVTVGSGNPVKDTLRFRQDGSSLRYEGSDYGTDGLTLVRKEKPAPAAKELIVWVKQEAECDRGPGFGKTKCYDVQYGDKPATPVADGWEKLTEPIQGFTFEKGHVYKLRVSRVPRDPRIQDVGAWEFRLVEVLSKEKAS